MAGWALALMAFYLALTFGVRVGVVLRTTGSTGMPRARIRAGANRTSRAASSAAAIGCCGLPSQSGCIRGP